MFGCPQPPATNFCKTGKKFLQKYTTPDFQNTLKRFFFFENLDLLKIFLLKVVVVNLFKFLYWFQTCIKRSVSKVDLLAPLLRDIEAINPCSFDFDGGGESLKNLPARTYSKKVVEDNYFLRPYSD